MMLAKQTSRTTCTAARAQKPRTKAKVQGRRGISVVVRAAAPETPEPETAKLPEASFAGADLGPSTSQNTPLLGDVQEAINGRSAMLGFVAAVVSESLTHQSVWSQIAGKYVDLELVEAPVGASSLGYFAVIVLVTVASLMPKLIDGLNPDSKSFGPFTPGLENKLGRVAMMGFAGLLLVEAVKSSSLL